MQRKTLNASQLQAEFSRRLNRRTDVVEDGVKIRVPRPKPHEPDARGCNWDMQHFGNAFGFERDIAAVRDAMRAEYNLSETGAHDAKDPNSLFGDPFGS